MLETNVLIRKLSIDNQKLRPLSDQDIKDIQAVLLEMMCDYDALCRKYDLKYFLCGGTALGAVRHNGFIEWDEDVDIGMPREDYDKLIELLLAEYGEKYWLQSIETSTKYDLPFLKIRKKGTRFLEIFEAEPEHAGVFIDIYPLENIPDFAPWRLLHGAVSDFLHLCCSCVRIKEKKQRYFDFFSDKKVLKLIKIKAFIGKCLSFFPLHKWCCIAQGWASNCKNTHSKYVSIPGGRKHYFGEMCTRASFFPLKEIDFEGKKFLIMKDPDEHLTALYGDYHIIPPASQRERHSVLELELGEKND